MILSWRVQRKSSHTRRERAGVEVSMDSNHPWTKREQPCKTSVTSPTLHRTKAVGGTESQEYVVDMGYPLNSIEVRKTVDVV